MEELIHFFQQHIELNQQEISFLQEQVHIQSIPKNHILLQEGEISQEFYFMVKGCVRLYYNAKDEEKTAYFYTENMFVSSYQSFTKQIPAKHNLAAVEDSDLIVFDIASVSAFTNFSPKFEFLARVMMEEELAMYQQIISSFVVHNAEERYLNLIKEQPELLRRIPQHQIATFLGITPETLSRIRRRILKK